MTGLLGGRTASASYGWVFKRRGVFPTIGSAPTPVARFVLQPQLQLTPVSAVIAQIGICDPSLQIDLPPIEVRITAPPPPPPVVVPRQQDL